MPSNSSRSRHNPRPSPTFWYGRRPFGTNPADSLSAFYGLPPTTPTAPPPPPPPQLTPRPADPEKGNTTYGPLLIITIWIGCITVFGPEYAAKILGTEEDAEGNTTSPLWARILLTFVAFAPALGLGLSFWPAVTFQEVKEEFSSETDIFKGEVLSVYKKALGIEEEDADDRQINAVA